MHIGSVEKNINGNVCIVILLTGKNFFKKRIIPIKCNTSKDWHKCIKIKTNILFSHDLLKYTLAIIVL